jgi:outer membrane protein assembly factor BamB
VPDYCRDRAACFADELIALNLADGDLRWRFATGTPNPDCSLPPAPVVVGDRIFYAGLNRILYGLDGQTGKLLWKHDLGKRSSTKLSVIGNSLTSGIRQIEYFEFPPMTATFKASSQYQLLRRAAF